MITNLYLRNFKGFGIGQNIPMSKITLLFGANSAGKTSIIQSLLLLKQTIMETGNSSTVLIPNGSLISLGNFREFVYKHDTSKEVQIGLKTDLGSEMHFFFRLNKNILEIAQFSGLAEKWLKNHSEISDWESIHLQGTLKEENVYNTKLINTEIVFNNLLNKSKIIDEFLKTINKHRSLMESSIRLLEGDKILFREKDSLDQNERAEYSSRVLNLLFSNIFNSIRQRSTESLHDEFSSIFSEITPQELERTTNLLARFDKSEIQSAFDEIIKEIRQKKIKSQINITENLLLSNPLLHRSTPSFESFSYHLNPLPLNKFELKEYLLASMFQIHFKIPSLKEIFITMNKDIQSDLTKILFLGPLRREPERYYFFTGNIPSEVGIKGSQMAEALFYSSNIKKEVNQKLVDLGIEYEIQVSPISEETSDIFSIRLADKTLGTNVSISDVGFGISQILPIIVQSYLSHDNIICIEQPEIHIHPRLQTGLAQLFYERILEKQNLQYIIETHSEHIILRFQRLIRNKQLSPSDLSVLYVKREKEGIQCKQLKMNQNGDFIDSWPEGFFEEAFYERFG